MKTNNTLTELDRRAAIKAAWSFVRHMEQVQRLPMRTRLYYFDVVFEVYETLRRHRMLGRREGEFNCETREEIRQLLSRKLNDDGRDED